jgi:succinoglycan biosynthesis protein ExoO
VLRQTLEDFELIVVDDGSSDGTLAVAQEHARVDARVVVQSKPNGGTASALNSAFKEARGSLFVALGADDYFKAEYLETMQGHILRCPQFDIYSCDLVLTYSDGTQRRFFGWDDQRFLSLEDMLVGGVIPGAATVFRPAVFTTNGGFREDLRMVEDEDFWMRALVAGFMHTYIPAALYHYVQGEHNQLTARVSEQQDARIRVLIDLVDSGALSQRQVRLAHRGIAECRAAKRVDRVRRFISCLLPGCASRQAPRVANLLARPLWTLRRRWSTRAASRGRSGPG